jgi:hypothetical protein
VSARQAEAVTIARSLPQGHVAAVHAMAAKLGLPRLLGPACPQRDLALALVISRVVSPASKLSTLTWWSDTTLGADLGVDDATTDQVYAAMDWLETRQDAIEARLARRHLALAANPSRMALFDLSSSWLEGSCCPLGERGYSRDGKKGKLQIEYGLLTDPGGRPVAVRVLPGSTGDPAAFTQITEVVRDKFGLREMVMVGDRGMITTARIKALKELDGSYGWIARKMAGPATAAGEPADARDTWAVGAYFTPGLRGCPAGTRVPAGPGGSGRARWAGFALRTRAAPAGEKWLSPQARSQYGGRLAATAPGKLARNN